MAKFAPSALHPQRLQAAGESATVKIEPSGKITILTGACPHGQGEETTFAQIAADELGVGLDDILVTRGDTAVVQYGINRKSTRLNSSHPSISYAVFCLKKKKK